MKTIILFITLLSLNSFSQEYGLSYSGGGIQIDDPTIGVEVGNISDYYNLFPKDQIADNPYGLTDSDIDFVASDTEREQTQRSYGSSCTRSLNGSGLNILDQSYTIDSNRRIGVDNDMLVLDLDHGCAKDVGANTHKISRTSRFGMDGKGGYQLQLEIPLYGGRGLGSIFQ